MNKNISIQIEPLDYYFFGGEETFNSGAKEITNYHVKSNRTPQQTGLIGLLRHALFEGGHPHNIGNSFDGTNTDFGYLKKISPLFISDSNGNILLPAPANITPQKGIISIAFKNEGAFFKNGEWENYTVAANNYDAKYGLGDWWINISTSELVESKNIFTTKDHIGINKQKQLDNRSAEGGFYKQEFISMTKGYSFSVIAELDESVIPDDLPRQLPFGGEKRTFAVKYKQTDFPDWQSIQTKTRQAFLPYAGNNPCIILLSDTYISNLDELNSYLSFAIMDESPFRNIITPGSVRNFGNFSRNPVEGGNKMYKTRNVTYLLKRGSVLFLKRGKADDVSTMLDNQSFQNIGYNHFLTYNN
ncbi:MAG: type III-B CRISPR module-associated Cmr3 family protein [Bacteroidota bacterium]|nr:type III-B CRISPR module-associated Cmr3 family protein [Bacteroidota bacterium]